MSVFIVVLVAGISTSVISLEAAQDVSLAEAVAMSQMEYTKSAAFQTAPATYAPVADLPAGYSVEAQAEAIPGLDSNIQKVVVTVYKLGETKLTIEDYKADR